jgi:hypothetical protein
VPGGESRITRPHLQLPDQRYTHRLADVQDALCEADIPGPALLDNAGHPQLLVDRLFRAVEGAAAAAVAQLVEDQHLPPEHRDGVIGAHLGAAAATSALLLVHHRGENTNMVSREDLGLEVQIRVGLLDVTVQDLHPAITHCLATPESGGNRHRQPGRHRGLAGAALTARYRYDHCESSPLDRR